MSPRTRIITLNIGSQTLELATFHIRSRDQLVLERYGSRDLPTDSTQEQSRQRQIATVLAEIQTQLQIKSGLVNYSVAEELIFTRFVELPSVSHEKIDQIVSFEAQQNVPFPIDEVVWGYELVGHGRNHQIQVILVAIKADLIEEINQAVEAHGLRTSIVDLATMALGNAFRYNYPELSGCSLLIDIGARTTNLLFLEPERTFVRSIPLGGSSITAAIVKEFNEPFAAAEQRKKLFTTNNEIGRESDAARVARLIDGALTRLHGEVQRSITHYCTQQQGQAPERIFLSGGSAGLACTKNFFQEKFNLPTALFDPLRKLVLVDSAYAEEMRNASHLLGEPVGLALRTLGDCLLRIDLCPKSVARRKEFEKRRPLLIAAVVFVILGFLGLGAFYSVGVHLLRQRTETIRKEMAALEQVESRLNEVRRRMVRLDRLAMPLVASVEARTFWLAILEELNACLPKEDIWITELSATSGGAPLDASGLPAPHGGRVIASASNTPGAGRAVTKIDGLLVRGLYLFNSRQQEVVVDYFRNLAGSPLFNLDLHHQAQALRPTTPTETEWAFPYELHVDLSKPVTLP